MSPKSRATAQHPHNESIDAVTLDTVTFVVTMEHETPRSRGAAKAKNRGEKHKQLTGKAEHHRQSLLGWLKEHNLSDLVTRVGEPNAFDMLFVEGSPTLIDSLSEAPGVLSIAPTAQIQLDPMPYSAPGGEPSDAKSV